MDFCAALHPRASAWKVLLVAAIISTIVHGRCVGKLPDSEPIVVMPNEEGIGWVW